MTAQITKKNICLLSNMNSQIRQSTDVEDGKWKTYRKKEKRTPSEGTDSVHSPLFLDRSQDKIKEERRTSALLLSSLPLVSTGAIA